MSEVKSFRSVALEERDYRALKNYSDEQGQNIGFHLKRAVRGYLAYQELANRTHQPVSYHMQQAFENYLAVYGPELMRAARRPAPRSRPLITKQ